LVPREDFGLSSLSALSLSAFFGLGFAVFFVVSAFAGCSLMRDERRGAGASSLEAAAAALRGIVSDAKSGQVKRRDALLNQSNFFLC
jgi:hypothetical protein